MCGGGFIDHSLSLINDTNGIRSADEISSLGDVKKLQN